MKRMWDKKKLEEMIQEGGSGTVDDSLSDTSEHPVQNKVIYSALEGKQDALPDITEQEGKYLKVGENGLEWGSINPLYLHSVNISKIVTSGVKSVNFKVIIISDRSSPYDIPSLASFLYTRGNVNNDHGYASSGACLLTDNEVQYSFPVYGVSSSLGENVTAHWYQVINGVRTAENYSFNSGTIYDLISQLL